MPAPPSVEAYLAELPDDQRQALERVRRLLHEAVPGVDERISYQIPTYRYRKKMLLAFGAWKAHCALYALSGTTLAKLGDVSPGRLTGKGTLHFTPEQPLPDDLIRRIVALRRAEIDGG